jgi:hypothetical protein
VAERVSRLPSGDPKTRREDDERQNSLQAADALRLRSHEARKRRQDRGRLSRDRRLHPAIKGVRGTQSSGTVAGFLQPRRLHVLRPRARRKRPISEAAAFAYTTALSRFLERGSANRIQIGDASTVFWADATNSETAKEAEDIFSALLNTVDENSEAKKVRAILEKIRMGRAPGVDRNTASAPSRARSARSLPSRGRESKPEARYPGSREAIRDFGLWLAPGATKKSARGGIFFLLI